MEEKMSNIKVTKIGLLNFWLYDDEEFDFSGCLRHFRLELVSHVVLLLLVPGEDADLADVCFQTTVENCVAKGTGTTGDE